MNILQAFSEAPPGYRWKFQPDVQTWLQTNSIRNGEACWYLRGKMVTMPAYCIELQPSAEDLIEVIAQVADKEWIDKAQLLDALMPAVRAIQERLYR